MLPLKEEKVISFLLSGVQPYVELVSNCQDAITCLALILSVNVRDMTRTVTLRSRGISLTKLKKDEMKNSPRNILMLRHDFLIEYPLICPSMHPFHHLLKLFNTH
jgi:hypothetical protein